MDFNYYVQEHEERYNIYKCKMYSIHDKNFVECQYDSVSATIVYVYRSDVVSSRRRSMQASPYIPRVP